MGNGCRFLHPHAAAAATALLMEPPKDQHQQQEQEQQQQRGEGAGGEGVPVEAIVASIDPTGLPNDKPVQPAAAHAVAESPASASEVEGAAVVMVDAMDVEAQIMRDALQLQRQQKKQQRRANERSNRAATQAAAMTAAVRKTPTTTPTPTEQDPAHQSTVPVDNTVTTLAVDQDPVKAPALVATDAEEAPSSTGAIRAEQRDPGLAAEWSKPPKRDRKATRTTVSSPQPRTLLDGAANMDQDGREPGTDSGANLAIGSVEDQSRNHNHQESKRQQQHHQQHKLIERHKRIKNLGQTPEHLKVREDVEGDPAVSNEAGSDETHSTRPDRTEKDTTAVPSKEQDGADATTDDLVERIRSILPDVDRMRARSALSAADSNLERALNNLLASRATTATAGKYGNKVDRSVPPSVAAPSSPPRSALRKPSFGGESSPTAGSGLSTSPRRPVSFAASIKPASPLNPKKPVTTEPPSMDLLLVNNNGRRNGHAAPDADAEHDVDAKTDGDAAPIDVPEGSQLEQESEADSKRRRMEELRRQQSTTAQKRMDKKKVRHDKFRQELEKSLEKRKSFWRGEIQREEEVVDLIRQFCGAEFCRGQNVFDRETALRSASEESQNELRTCCHKAYRDLYRDEIHSRVVVKDAKQPDLNGRTGKIQSWDKQKGKFYVALDSRKGKHAALLYLRPEYLEALATTANKSKGKARQAPLVFPVYVDAYYANRELTVDVNKQTVDRLAAAESTEAFLDVYVQSRDHEDAVARQLAEERKQEEMEARRRCAEMRRREEEDWQRRKAADKEQAQTMRQEQQRARREQSGGVGSCHPQHGNANHFFLGDPFLFNIFFGSPRFRNNYGWHDPRLGGIPGGGFYAFFEDGDEDDWDAEFERIHEDEVREKNVEAASILGVSVDATEHEIKRAYRSLARKFHPDSYRLEKHGDGTTKKEAEEHFKKLSSAHDHLISNFAE
jgi:hypothetical protein